MNQHRTVLKAMISMKLEGMIPGHYLPFLQPYLMQVYAAGWEECRDDFCRTSNKWVAQIDRKEQIINTFKSLKKASDYTGFKIETISKAIKSGNHTRHGYKWVFIPTGVGYVPDIFQV